VAPEVTRAKFGQQIQRWHENAETYAHRGWLLLSVGDLSVNIGMLQNVDMAGRTVPVMTVCTHIDYWNFDLWAPSVTFIDPVTRQPTPPIVRAPNQVGPDEPRDALIDGHPDTLQPFLCLPGIREYHSHPQHTGDDWLLHRNLHEGDLAVVCDRLWRLMARNVIGFGIGIKLQQVSAAGAINMPLQLDVQLLQGDPDLLHRELAQQAAQQAAIQALQAQMAAQQAAVQAALQTEGGVAAADAGLLDAGQANAVPPDFVDAGDVQSAALGPDHQLTPANPQHSNAQPEADKSGPNPRS